MKPNIGTMCQHLEHLFGGDLGGMHDGLVEIAWSDAKSHKLQHARHFGTDELDEAAEFAAAENAKPNQNVYVGAALRKPNSAPFGRANDDDFYAMTCFYADLDDGDAVRKAKERCGHCPPTLAVWTSRKPQPRVQLWWRQELPEPDPDVCRQQNAAIAKALDGDSSVINPSRVMRLAGSIAWPLKEGREKELTELVTFDDRQVVYFFGQVAKAFPCISENDTTDIESTEPDFAADVDPVALLRAAKPGEWHVSMRSFVAHCVSAGYPDWVILEASRQVLDNPGDASDVEKLIETARKKWNTPDPGTASVDPIATPLEARPIANVDPADIPQRKWVFGRRFQRGKVTVTVAPPGVGKTSHAMHEAVTIASGRDWAGQDACDPGPVWIYNNEDDDDEMLRRVHAVLDHMGVEFAAVEKTLFMNSGADRPLMVAREDKKGQVIRMPDVEACICQIRVHGIRLFIVDPFVEVHGVNENDNVRVKEVAAMFRRIAQDADCAVHLVHHTRKPPSGSSDGYAGSMDSARGASALAGVARIMDTLFSMSSKDAENLGVPADDRHLYIRLDGAKANESLVSDQARWFRRDSIELPNGDTVGVLTPVTLDEYINKAEHDREQRQRQIMAWLLKNVSDGTTLNQAGLAAIDKSGLFKSYEGRDFKGRCPATVRGEIEATAKAGIHVNKETFRLESRSKQSGATVRDTNVLVRCSIG